MASSSFTIQPRFKGEARHNVNYYFLIYNAQSTKNKQQKEGLAMDARIKNGLSAHLTAEEVGLIEGFLNRGFSPNGQSAIASIFLFAKDHQKSVTEVLSECEKEWMRNWQYQHPDIKGDADAPGAAGLQNRSSLENVYHALGVPSPMNKKKEVPKKEITVATQNSVYRFGRADKNGERTISRDERPLDFSRCKIVCLSVGQDMEIDCLDGDHPKWYTTTVLSIK